MARTAHAANGTGVSGTAAVAAGHRVQSSTKARSTEQGDGVVLDDTERPSSPDFGGAIYDAITAVFSNKNPTQMFCLNWPGTILDYEHLAWDDGETTAGNMPERALIRTSQILDQYVPPAQITQPDGTRVSDRYRQAVSQLGPVPNEALIKLQALVRGRLQQKVSVVIDGKPQEVSLIDWFQQLYLAWARARGEWGEKQQAEIERFRRQYPLESNTAWDAYLEWYANNADAYIGKINALYQRLLAEFPLTEWEDAISILDTTSNRALKEAKELARNNVFAVPRQEGIDYAPTFGLPYDWPRELQPTSKFLDLLADPDMQQAAVDTAVSQLQSEILAWMAIVPQVSDETVAKSARRFDEQLGDYQDTQTELRKVYFANTVEAVKIIMEAYTTRGTSLLGTPIEKQPAILKEVNDLRSVLDTQNGTTEREVNWEELEKIVEGQNTLIDAQAAVIKSGRDLAGAAQKFLEDQGASSRFSWLEGYVAQLTAKLNRLLEMQRNMASASNVYYGYLPLGEGGGNPNRAPGFGGEAEPSTLDWPENSRWSKVTVKISREQLNASESLSTYFSTLQWGVDLFLASAGGTTSRDGSQFASAFMKESGDIELAFLAAKVLINRPWMRPEIFQSTAEYFRTVSTPLSPKTQVTREQLSGRANEGALLKLLQENSFPAYPVAALLVKDLSVKVKYDIAQTDRMREYDRSVKSESGGFFCFSVSSTETTQSQRESVNSYCMGGELVTRIPSPQIIGYWVQFLPPDKSEVINAELVDEIIRAIGFVDRMKDVGTNSYESTDPPVKAGTIGTGGR